jgi:hypothetical protein
MIFFVIEEAGISNSKMSLQKIDLPRLKMFVNQIAQHTLCTAKQHQQDGWDG